MVPAFFCVFLRALFCVYCAVSFSSNAARDNQMHVLLVSLIRDAPLASYLHVKDVLNLAISCREVFNETKNHINRTLLFRYNNHNLQWYQPQRMKVGESSGTTMHDLSSLPPSLTHLSFDHSFNQPVKGLLPPNLIHLTFGDDFDHPVDDLPPKLTRLTFSLACKFNRRVDCLPRTLTHLSFGYTFSQPMENIPPFLTHLHLGSHFTEALNLPDSLLELTVDLEQSGLREPKISKLPPNLTTLDCMISDWECVTALPDSIKKLSLFKHEFIKFPSKLEYLKFVPCENQMKELPSTLRGLSILGEDDVISISSFPPNLQKLRMLGKIEVTTPLPVSVTHLSLVDMDWDEIQVSSLLPPNLTHLKIDFGFSQQLDIAALPLVSLKIRYSQFTHSLSLPPTLKFMMSSTYNHSLELPPSLEELIIGSFSGAFSNLPSTLKRLMILRPYSAPLPALPDGLEELSVNDYSYPLLSLPRNLKKLFLGHAYNNSLPPLPPTLVMGYF